MQSAVIGKLIIWGFIACLVTGCAGTREHLGPKPRANDQGQPAEAPPPAPPAADFAAAEDQDESTIEPVHFVDEEGSDVPPAPAAPAELAAPTAAGGELTLEFFERLALGNNPAIQQASAVAGKAAGIWQQVGLRPNPQVGYFGEEIGNDNSNGLQGAFVMQTVVTGGKLDWNREVIGHDAQMVLWEVEAQRFRVQTDIRTRFYDALAAQRRIELARDFHKVAEQGLDVSEKRMEAKVGARPDVLQSEIQVNEVDLLIQRAEIEFAAAWNELVAVAGVPDMVPTRLLGNLEAPVVQRETESLYVQIVEESPMIRAARSRVQRARSNLERQRVQPIPNVIAQVGAGHDTFTGNEFANVQIGLPIPVHNYNQGNVSAAYAEYCEATHNLQRMKLQIRRRLAVVMREYQSALVTVERYETTILPKTTESMDLIQEAQEAGEFNFLRVLTARRAFFDANLEYLAALTDLAKANAEIDGLLLTGGLTNVVTYDARDDLRGQALNYQ